MIQVCNLERSFGSHKILDGVSFCIDRGESVVIIGRSGGGKSVLLKHLIALLKPDSGQVLIDGENIVPMNERQLLRVRRKFGMVFQGAALFDSMTVSPMPPATSTPRSVKNFLTCSISASSAVRPLR